jgi:glycosyltransferase involved in cell wall biosynthesis
MLNSKPLVSVIVPFLNSEKFIREAIESVFAQTYNNWEILLIDDGSTDRGTEIALQYAEQYPEKVRYLEHKNHLNRGITISSNLGIRNANGEYIALLDSDDVWLPQKLEEQVAILESQPEAGMVFGLSRYWSSWTGNPEDRERDYVPEIGIQPNMLFKPPTLLMLLYPLGDGISPCPSDLLLRRKLVESIGGFEESFTGRYQLYQDQAFLAKVYLKAPVFFANKCWDWHRLHESSCVSIAKKAGNYHAARLFFLSWLKKYLSKQGFKNADVWYVLKAKLRPYRRTSLHPFFYHLLRYMLFLRKSLAGKGAVSAYEGYLDRADCNMISGWAWDMNSPNTHIYVDIYDGGSLLATVKANEFRRDLLTAGKGAGKYAFSYPVSKRLKNGKPHEIWVKVAGTNFALVSTPQEINCEQEMEKGFLNPILKLIQMR